MISAHEELNSNIVYKANPTERIGLTEEINQATNCLTRVEIEAAPGSTASKPPIWWKACWLYATQRDLEEYGYSTFDAIKVDVNKTLYPSCHIFCYNFFDVFSDAFICVFLMCGGNL